MSPRFSRSASVLCNDAFDAPAASPPMPFATLASDANGKNSVGTSGVISSSSTPILNSTSANHLVDLALASKRWPT
jgi:hypothetical protein